jgi:hypothetical protein
LALQEKHVNPHKENLPQITVMLQVPGRNNFFFLPLLSGFNPAPMEAGTAVPSIMPFVPVFYIMGHVGYYAGGLVELCHECVSYA